MESLAVPCAAAAALERRSEPTGERGGGAQGGCDDCGCFHFGLVVGVRGCDRSLYESLL